MMHHRLAWRHRFSTSSRLELWQHIQSLQKYQSLGKKIKITLKDGKQFDGISGVTSPFDIAASISQSFAQKFIVSKVNGKLYDYAKPLDVDGDCNVEFLDFESSEGKHVFWHSSAHILGQALESLYSAKLAIGPPIQEGGFFYDVYTGEK